MSFVFLRLLKAHGMPTLSDIQVPIAFSSIALIVMSLRMYMRRERMA